MQTLEATDPGKTKRKVKAKWIIWPLAILLVLLALGYVGVSVYGAMKFTTSTFYNIKDLGPDTPAARGMPYQDITFKTTDAAQLTIYGWWIPRTDSDKVLILVHSKDGTRTFLLPFGQRLWQEGFNILMFDTRGQGQSEGERYSFGLYEKYDVLGAVNFVTGKGFLPGKIGVVGWSMGAPAALLAMSETPNIKAGLLDSSYGNLDRVAQETFTTWTGLPDFFYPGIKTAASLLFNFDITQANPEKVFPLLGDRKIFLIHAEKDQLIPVDEFYRLQKAGGANIAESWLVPGVEHVRSFQTYPDEYTRRAVDFFNSQLK
ncbi:MAG TPA: alpha/beta fold hydrolase [Chloroflexia bacterium]|nr:alpha/beta fold hydrolase [Chloroflexia bacterium]